MFSIKREFAPITIYIRTESDLKQLQDVLYLAHKATQGTWGRNPDTNMARYIEYLIKELK